MDPYVPPKKIPNFTPQIVPFPCIPNSYLGPQGYIFIRINQLKFLPPKISNKNLKPAKSLQIHNSYRTTLPFKKP